MSDGISVFERDVINKVLEGDYPSFSMLRKQIGSLTVKCRANDEEGQYLIEFNEVTDKKSKLKDEADSFQINDAVLTVKESNEVIYCRLTVIGGWIRYLDMYGDCDFEDGLTLKEVKWKQKKFDGQKYSSRLVKESSEREYETAIDYIPKYK